MILDGDCIEVMRGMDARSVDAIVTDPPYGLGFMGKAWDALPPGIEWAAECLRVLKPGGHLLAFGGTRTSHRLVCAIDDAGFEIRDTIAWLYGSGFPKSHNLKGEHEGWGTALKPAHEPIVVARKPLVGTVAANVLAHGTGALNVDGCRIGSEATTRERTPDDFGIVNDDGWKPTPGVNGSESGRWPANVLLDPKAAVMLDEQTGDVRSAGEYVKGARRVGAKEGAASIPIDGLTSATYGDKGGASRFYYVAKASSRERDAGLDGFEERQVEVPALAGPGRTRGGDLDGRGKQLTPPRANLHPTVKPIRLMRWLVRLVTPPGGTVLDPFTGSGTTGCACVLEGFEFVGIEREPEYAAIARARIAHWTPRPPDQLSLEAA